MKNQLFALVCTLMLSPLSASAQKSIYIPSGWSYNSSTKEYYQDGYYYSLSRKRESDNFVVFWTSEYGTTAPDELPTSDFYYVNVNDLLQKAEGFYQLYAETLKFVDPEKSTTMSKYKCMIMLQHSDVWAAYGGGYDFVVPALWINPQTCKPVGHTIAHEVGHSFHYMCFAEGNNHRNSNSVNTGFHLACGNGQAIWEQTAQWQANQAYPSEMFGQSYPLFGNNANYAFSHEWMRYQSYWFMYYLCQHYDDITTVAQVWNTPMTGQSEGNGTDFCSALIKLKNLTPTQFYALYFDYALHCATFDFDAAARYRNNYIGRFDYRAVQLADNKYQVAYSSTPQSTGFNVIELKVPAAGTSITTHFTGLQPGCDLNKADPGLYNDGNANALVSADVTRYNTVSRPSARGFRVGYVFLKSNGTREYYNDETVHCTGTDVVTEDITATVPTGTSRLFLVVAPALSTYVMHKWDDRIQNDDQWPYQFEIEGTTAKSITPYIEEPDFEQQIDGRSIADVTLTYNVVLPPSSTAYTGATVSFSGSGLNALCTAFQLPADDIFSRIVNYSASGPQNGQIMNYAANADGTLQRVGKGTNGDFGHWFNASGKAVSHGSGCVAYAEFSKSSKSAVVGQYPNANTSGTRRTIREALCYKDSNGKTATAYLVFNIRFESDVTPYSYLTAIDYVKPETAGIPTPFYHAAQAAAITLSVKPGESVSYTLTDDDTQAVTSALNNISARNLTNSMFKGYIYPITSIVTPLSIYYYAIDGEPTLQGDGTYEVAYYNIGATKNDPDYNGKFTLYYDADGKIVEQAEDASIRLIYSHTDKTFTLAADAECPLAVHTLYVAMVRNQSNFYAAYFPITAEITDNPIPTGIKQMKNEEFRMKNTDAVVYDLQGRRVGEMKKNSDSHSSSSAGKADMLPSSLSPGIYIVGGQKVLIR